KGGPLSLIVLLPLIMFAVSLSIRFASASARVQQRRVKQRDIVLRQLLSASRDRETLLKTILDTIDVGILAVDSTGQTLLTNNQQKAFRRMAGVNVESEGRQTGPLPLLSQDRITPLPPEKLPSNRASHGETFADYLVWLGTGTEQRALSTAAKSMLDDDGQFNGAVVVYNDVTDVMNALSAKEELLSNVSHEFGSPLTSFMGNIDLVLSASEELNSK